MSVTSQYSCRSLPTGKGGSAGGDLLVEIEVIAVRPLTGHTALVAAWVSSRVVSCERPPFIVARGVASSESWRVKRQSAAVVLRQCG